ncbi:hypothetical protein [Psychrilyobacter sp. S5]|nr:hypothetical protein [Psychrilyobacter sp. S5]
MRYRLKDNEAIVHENENTILTDKNIIKESGKIFKKKTVIKLGDIRRKRIEGDNIIISIMRKKKIREISFIFSKDSIEEIFNKLDELIARCKKNNYKTTTSKYLEDLIDEEDNPYQYKYRKKKYIIVGILTTLFLSFTFLLTILYSIFEIGITFYGILLISLSHYIIHSYFYYFFNKLIFLDDDVIYRTFYMLRYRRLNIKKNVELIIPIFGLGGTQVKITFHNKKHPSLPKQILLPKGFFAVDPLDIDEFEEILLKSLKYKKVNINKKYHYEIYKN